MIFIEISSDRRLLLPLARCDATPITKSIAITDSNFVYHFRTGFTDLVTFQTPNHRNLFFSHILPLVHSSPLVRVSVEAVAAAHLHVLGTASLINTTDLQSEALRLLSVCLNSAITDPDGPSGEECLIASLLLIYYEVNWFERG